MRCWLFHRAGGFASHQFSVNAFPKSFLAVVIGYAPMSRKEPGFDPTIDAVSSVTLAGRVYELDAKPFFIAPGLASKGTTCWYARLRGETEFSYAMAVQ